MLMEEGLLAIRPDCVAALLVLVAALLVLVAAALRVLVPTYYDFCARQHMSIHHYLYLKWLLLLLLMSVTTTTIWRTKLDNALPCDLPVSYNKCIQEIINMDILPYLRYLVYS